MKSIVLLIVFNICLFPQSKPLQKSSSDSLKNNRLQRIYNTKIEINDIGIVKSPIARITDDIEMISTASIKLNRGDTVIVKFYYPTIKICYVTHNRLNGYIDSEKLACGKIFEFRDSIQKEIELNKLKRIEEWEAKKLLDEIKTDSLRLVEEKKFTKEMTKKYGKKWGKIVGERKIKIGMTEEMVIDSWGKPEDINRSVGSWGVHEQWIYGDTYLYIENGKLTSWQD